MVHCGISVSEGNLLTYSCFDIFGGQQHEWFVNQPISTYVLHICIPTYFERRVENGDVWRKKTMSN